MQYDVAKETISVDVDGEIVKYDVFVDTATGLDVDPNTGNFCTRVETRKIIADVYRVGKDSLPKELERYNKWMKKSLHSDVSSALLQRSNPVALPSSASAQNVSREKKHDLSSSVDFREEAFRLRVRGNDAMRSGDARRALSLYEKALGHDASASVLWSNMAAVKLQLGRLTAALSDAERAALLDSTNVKAHYRKTLALCLTGAQSAAQNYMSNRSEIDMTDSAWQSLKKRLEMTSAAILVNDRWVCSDDIKEEGKELSALKAFSLPSTCALETLHTWSNEGVPQDLLTMETAYYTMRGYAPTWDFFSGILAAQRLCEVLSVESVSADLLRWSSILGVECVRKTLGCESCTETVFENKYVVFGAALFASRGVDRSGEGNVKLFFDASSSLLRVVSSREIHRYETLFLAS